MSSEWKSFLRPADEWILCYATAPVLCHAVQFFAVGHALELYLKAVHCKITANIARTIKYGHNVEALWSAIKTLDQSFAPSFELRPSVLAVKTLKGGHEEVLSLDDFRHFVEHQELYRSVQHLADLKYMGAPMKSVSGQIGYAFGSPDPMWQRLFAEMRTYIGRGEVNDWMATCIEHSNLSPDAKRFVEPILQAWRV